MNMLKKYKDGLLLILTLVVFVGVLMLPPVSAFFQYVTRTGF